jgi:hypothetical protein
MTDDLPASVELDALIAEKVMGLKPCVDPVGRCEGAHMTPPRCWGTGKGGSDLQPYSTSIAAAWEIVEILKGRIVIDHWNNDDYRVMLYIPSAGRSIEASGSTAPLAICRAALAISSRDR